MNAEHQAVRDLYRSQGYELMAAGFGHRGVRLDLVCTRREQLAAVVVSAERYVKERLNKDQIDAGMRARRFPDEQAAIDAGLTIGWTDGPGGSRVQPGASPAMDFKILLGKTDDFGEQNDSRFGLELDDTRYAPCMFSVDKTAYDRFAKSFLTELGLLSQSRKEELLQLYCVWDVWTQTEVIGGNACIMPHIALNKFQSEEAVKRILNAFSANG